MSGEPLIPSSTQYTQPGRARLLSTRVAIRPPAPPELRQLLQNTPYIVSKGDPLYHVLPSDAGLGRITSNAKAVFDTGATQTCITPDLAYRYGVPSGTTYAHTANGVRLVLRYTVGLLLSRTLLLSAMDVLAVDVAGTDTDVLIGMDVLGQIKFHFGYDPDEDQSTFVLEP